MDKKKLFTIDKIFRLTQQDAEFNEELRNKLGIVGSSAVVVNDDERINQIYEYCIEEIIRRQAKEFYKDFPLKTIVDSLVEDFVRMESFKRKDNFGDFSLSLYQQIECITNKMCESKELTNIAEKMWGSPAYVKQEMGKEITVSNRLNSEYTVASLIFPGRDKNSGLPNSIKKSQSALQSQYALDKIRAVVYFVGYKASMKSGDYDSYKEITSLLYDIYQCRNMNHRGNTQNPWEKEVLDRILPMKSFYYFKFMGVLAQYVEYIKNGFPHLKEIETYANTLKKQKVKLQGPKIIGKIDLDTYKN